MRRARALALALVVSSAAALAAQGKSIEIGTFLGYTKLTQPGASAVTVWGAPGGSVNASPTVYVTILGPRPAFIEFQAGYSRISSDNNLAESIDLLGRLGWLSKPFAKASWYAAADAAYEHLHASTSFGTSTSVSGPAYGGAIGYRLHVGRGAAVRVETHYRWWKGDFDSLHEFGVGVGFGGIL
jgi:hypothetical protein